MHLPVCCYYKGYIYVYHNVYLFMFYTKSSSLPFLISHFSFLISHFLSFHIHVSIIIIVDGSIRA